MIVHRQLCDGVLKGWNQTPSILSRATAPLFLFSLH
jgi:hypothetical protein